MKPIWLLDIDGVINARVNGIHRIWPDDEPIVTEAQGLDRGWRIVTAPAVRDYIVKIHELELAEIQWHTTWQDQANNVSDVLELPHFPVCSAPEYTEWSPGKRKHDWWKVPAVARVLISGRPLIWTDDDIDYDEGVLRTLELDYPDTPRLALCPSSGEGLGPKDLKKIDAFLKEQWKL